MRYNYTRVCISCGDTATVGYKPKGTEMCRSCASKVNVKLAHKVVKEKPRIRYWYFCSKCSSVREAVAKRRTTLCEDCNRSLAAKRHTTKEVKTIMGSIFIKVPVRYFRVCKECGDVKQVGTQTGAGYKMCRACYNKKREEAKQITKARKKHRPKVQISKEEVARRREENRRHREATKKLKKKPTQTLSEEEMIAQWLKKNKPSICEDNKISGVLDEGKV